MTKRFLPLVVLLSALVGCTGATQWRTRPPPRPEPASITERLPVVQEMEIAGGLNLLLAPRSHAPLVSVQIVLLTGHDDDPEDKAGLAALSSSALAEHARSLNLEGCAAPAFGKSDVPEITVESDGVRIGATVLPGDAEAVLARFAAAIETVSVEDEDLHAIKRSSVAAGSTRRGIIGGDAIAKIVLGREDSLSRPSSGCEESRSRITTADVERFFDEHLRPENMAIVVAGRIVPEDVAGMVQHHFGAWARKYGGEPMEGLRVSAPAAVSLDSSSTAERSRGSAFLAALGIGSSRPRPDSSKLPVVRVSNRNSPRLVVALGSPAAPSDAAGEAALRMAEYALGGALRWHLREESRLSYRVSHQLVLHRHGGLLAASATMPHDAVPEATSAARRAVVDASRWLERESGFDLIRNAALQALMDELDTVHGLGDAVARTYQRGLPANHHIEVARAMESAPPARVGEVLERLLDPAVARILLIGVR